MKIWNQFSTIIQTDYRLFALRFILSLVPFFILLKGVKMFEHIPEINLAIALGAVAVVSWILCIQYSRYVMHKKKHVNDEKYEEPFAIVPYFIVPVLFGALSVIGGLWIGDYLTIKEYLAGTEEVLAVTTVASVIVYGILDYYIVSHVGDAVYFETIEADMVKSAKQPDDTSKEDLKALLRELLK